MNFYRFIWLLFGLALISCAGNNDEIIPPQLGHEFFPLKTGAYVIYKADSIHHDQPVADIPGIHDTLSYYIKEVIDEEFNDAEEKPSMRIVRYKRQNPDDEWQLKNIWYARINNLNAQRVEENKRYIKMGFPISTRATWDGNALNDLKEWRCTYDSLYQSKKMGDLHFNQTVTVNMHKYLTEVNDEFAKEIYAKDVGLIFRHHKVLFTRPSYLNNRSAKNIISGYEYTWQIVEYGME